MLNSTEQKEQNSAVENAELPVIVSKKEAKEKGLKRYFTGKPCRRGHISERRTCNSGCYECINLMERSEHRVKYKTDYRKKYRKDNKDALSLADKIYTEKNKDKIKAKKALYRINNLTEIKRKKRIYHLKNKCKSNKKSKEYAAKNKAKRNVVMRAYLKRPEAKAAAMCRSMLHRILRLSSNTKTSKTECELGYSSLSLKPT